MWSVERIAGDLRDLGVLQGRSLIVHASMRSIGPIEGGARGLIDALRSVVGSEGSIMAPTFTPQFRDPDEWANPPETEGARERIRANSSAFDKDTTPSDLPRMGIFSEVLRQQPDAARSDHPTLSFAAVGEQAASLVKNTPFHYPLGSESPLARLHDGDGWVLLLGVGHEVNTSVHLAEVWANAPYIHRTARVKTSSDEWNVMKGSPECSDGFIKIEIVLRSGRLMRRGYVGNAMCQLIRQRELVSMAIAMIQGSGDSLLCDRSSCRDCTLARTFTSSRED